MLVNARTCTCRSNHEPNQEGDCDPKRLWNVIRSFVNRPIDKPLDYERIGTIHVHIV